MLPRPLRGPPAAAAPVALRRRGGQAVPAPRQERVSAARSLQLGCVGALKVEDLVLAGHEALGGHEGVRLQGWRRGGGGG